MCCMRWPCAVRVCAGVRAAERRCESERMKTHFYNIILYIPIYIILFYSNGEQQQKSMANVYGIARNGLWIDEMRGIFKTAIMHNSIGSSSSSIIISGSSNNTVRTDASTPASRPEQCHHSQRSRLLYLGQASHTLRI